MTAARWAGGLAALVLVVSGCTRLAPVFHPGPWDSYGEAGPLPVRGADRDAPGPSIVRALRSEPKVAPVLERYGDPDAVEVSGGRYQPKEIVLVFRRPARRIRVDSSSDGWVAHAPEAVAGRPRRAAARQAPHPADGQAADAEAAPARPTTAQSLECPIDPSRADCRALCTPGTAYEWCP